MWIDSHCHLDRLDPTEQEGGLDGVIQSARQAGVGHILTVGVRLEEHGVLRGLCERYDDISMSVGLHPADAVDRFDPQELQTKAYETQVVAVGETGLDYYHQEVSVQEQQERFRLHIQVARACAKPLIIHTRDAPQDTVRLLREEKASEVGGVFHCFTGDEALARQALDLGFFISFSGIITFKNAESLRAVAREVPLDRILVETDAPYLAPTPYRGKPNRPAYVVHVGQALALLRGEAVERVAEQTSLNMRALFLS